MAHALDGSAPAILRNSELDAEAVRAARSGCGSFKSNSKRIMKSTQRRLSAQMLSTAMRKASPRTP